MMQKSELLLTPRAIDAHKGSFGRVLLVGGARGMAGSIALSAMAAMRSGTGLGHVAVPDQILETVASFEPGIMTHPLACDAAGRLTMGAAEELASLIEGIDAIGIGPGFSRTSQAAMLARTLVATIESPMVVDADALFGLAANLDSLRQSPATRVLTPHPGEFARLTGSPTPTDPDKRCHVAADFAASFDNTILVLKGAGTVVTDGTRTVVNETGNPGMATAGAGDVLTGIITSLLGQGFDAFGATALAVRVHGRAGDLAAAELSQTALVATDLIAKLPQVWLELETQSAASTKED